MGKSNPEYEGLDPFSVEVQFGLYIRRVFGSGGMRRLSGHQLKELQRAFYGAWGQCLVVTRDEMPDDEDEAVEKLQSMWEQVGKYWTDESRGKN